MIISEPPEAGDDDQPVDRAVLVRLQAPLEPGGVRRRQQSPRPLHTHLAARHRPLQQVKRLSLLRGERREEISGFSR